MKPLAKVWKAPAIPARKPGWETAFIDIMARHDALPFGYGRSDCLTVPADLCKGMTGVDPMRGSRRYKTETGAAKQLFKLGLTDVESALKSVFPIVAKSNARRGDCGVLEQVVDGRPQLVTMIVIQCHMAKGKGQDGAIFVPVDQLKSTFAIGAL